MFSLFRRAEVSVSITDQDGTPNSLLEAMAAGAVPVCSDLPSIREWIEHGSNGFLAAFDDPQAVANALRLALDLLTPTAARSRREPPDHCHSGRVWFRWESAAGKYRELAMHRRQPSR